MSASATSSILYPPPVESDLPIILDLPAPRLLCYSRMKDFYDIRLLAQEFDVDGYSLVTAVRLTFEQRGAKVPSEIDAFTPSFIDAK